MSPDRFELLAAIAARTRENAFSEANADPDVRVSWYSSSYASDGHRTPVVVTG